MSDRPQVPDFPSPTLPASSRREVLLRYLDYFRAVVIAKVADLPDEQARASRLPSGWAPVELRERGERSRVIVVRHDLDEVGAPGERWEGAPRAMP